MHEFPTLDRQSGGVSGLDPKLPTPTTGTVPQSSAARRKTLLIVAALIFIIAGASALTAHFVLRQKDSVSGNGSSATNLPDLGHSTIVPTSTSLSSETSTTAPSPTATVNPPIISRGQLIGYYGQNAVANGVAIIGGINSRTSTWSDYQHPLVYYCNTGLYNTINLAFLDIFGGGRNSFTITFAGFSESNYGGVYVYQGNGRETNPADIVRNYIALGRDIKECQAQGVKIVLSLGGDKTSPYLFIPGDGAKYAQLFYDMFLEGKGPVRPFGPGVVLDGIELDIEKNTAPSIWNPEMISLVKNLRRLSPGTLLAIVPQCFLNGESNKDLNVGDVIADTADYINYIIVQYYNNPTCSYPFGFNFNSWKTLYKGLIIVGLAGDWTSAISGGFLPPGQLQAVYDMVSQDPQFGGFSIYDVSSSNPPALSWNATNYKNPPTSEYSKTVKNVLSGHIVGSGFPPQGPAVPETLFAHRCGGTWIGADSNCTNRPCTTKAQCGVNQECFMYLQKTC
ncbi:glycoside hydrolase superfamily [Obelidium mucronatum]|nr:glycoside hydrolase superfamily [Obelidium mucronatum]